jgi:putative sigma-54 modulation protein
VQIEYTGRQTEVTPALKALTEKKLAKLEKVLPGITHVHVILAADKRRRIAELTVHSRHLDLTAVEENSNFAVSLGTAVDRLVRQAQKHRGKIRERKGGATVRGAAVRPPAPPASDEPSRVVKSRRFVAKPMTVDEAVLEVNASAEGLVVFRDAATERLNVLYKRKDGNLGLIEPES